MILWEINIGRSIVWMLSDIITISFNLHLKGHSYICRTYVGITFNVHIQSTQLNVIQAVRHDKWRQVTDIKTQFN